MDISQVIFNFHHVHRVNRLPGCLINLVDLCTSLKITDVGTFFSFCCCHSDIRNRFVQVGHVGGGWKVGKA